MAAETGATPAWSAKKAEEENNLAVKSARPLPVPCSLSSSACSKLISVWTRLRLLRRSRRPSSSIPPHLSCLTSLLGSRAHTGSRLLISLAAPAPPSATTAAWPPSLAPDAAASPVKAVTGTSPMTVSADNCGVGGAGFSVAFSDDVGGGESDANGSHSLLY